MGPADRYSAGVDRRCAFGPPATTLPRRKRLPPAFRDQRHPRRHLSRQSQSVPRRDGDRLRGRPPARPAASRRHGQGGLGARIQSARTAARPRNGRAVPLRGPGVPADARPAPRAQGRARAAHAVGWRADYHAPPVGLGRLAPAPEQRRQRSAPRPCRWMAIPAPGSTTWACARPPIAPACWPAGSRMSKRCACATARNRRPSKQAVADLPRLLGPRRQNA